MKARMAGIVTSKKTLITKNGKMMAFIDMEDLFGPVEVVVFPNVYEKYSALTDEDSLVAVSGTIHFKEGEVPKLLADTITSLKKIKEGTAQFETAQRNFEATQRNYDSGQRNFEARPPMYDAPPQEPDYASMNWGEPQPPQQAAPANKPQTAPPDKAARQPAGLVKIRLPEGDGIHNIEKLNQRVLAEIEAVMRRHPGDLQSILYFPQGGSTRTNEELWVDGSEAFAEEIKAIVGENNYKQ